jgi:hypothetical protein
MAGDLIQHMIEKVHAGGESGLSLAVQIQGNRDLGLQGVALNLRGSLHDNDSGL